MGHSCAKLVKIMNRNLDGHKEYDYWLGDTKRHGRIVNILAFIGHTVSVTTTQLPHHEKAAKANA